MTLLCAMAGILKPAGGRQDQCAFSPHALQKTAQGLCSSTPTAAWVTFVAAAD
jgi:hypothetical protein